MPRVNDASEALRNPTRAALLSAIQDAPGILQGGLVERLGCTRTTVRHHLEALVRARLVHVVTFGQRSAAFPATMTDPVRRAWAVLVRGRTMEFVQHVRGLPGVTQAQLCRDLAMSRKLLRKYVDRLAGAGLMLEMRTEAGVAYTATPRLDALLGPMPAEAIARAAPAAEPALVALAASPDLEA